MMLRLIFASLAAASEKVMLLYDMDPGEGFNFRKNCIHRVFSLVRALQKHDAQTEWTIVLPTFRNRSVLANTGVLSGS